MRDAVAQERIGQQAHAVEIDEYGRMTDVFDSAAQDRKSASAELPVAQDP